MGFKEDGDFARFVSMGAVGSAKVGRVLRQQYLHRPIELERYAMANKVWQTKVKRLRLPDLVCLRCGRRIESRAKSKLGIVVSHSEQPGRRWNEGGMRADDLYAFVRADLRSGTAQVGMPIFFSSAALNAAVGRSKLSAPKAASEGSEVTITWPSWVPNRTGIFEEVDGEGRIVCRWDDGGVLRYWHWRKWGEPRYLYMEPGSHVEAEDTMVAGVVARDAATACAGDVWDVAAALKAEEDTEQYAGIKAAGILRRADLGDELARIEVEAGDWRIRLEAVAALARLDPAAWTRRVISLAEESDSRDEARMEAIFTLSEIATDEAAEALAAVATESSNPVELRAAAAWGLGRGAHPRPDLLLPLIASPESLVGLHAIVALESLPEDRLSELAAALDSGDDRIAASAARVLTRHRCVDALLDVVRRGGRARLWALAALGDLTPELVRGSGSLDDETEQTLEPMWLAQDDWLRHHEGRDGLDALDVQTVRFDPTNP